VRYDHVGALRQNLTAFAAACFVSATFHSLPLAAHGYEKGELKVRHPWTRVPAAGEKSAGAYMEIRNAGKESERLIGAASSAAERIELYVVTRTGESATIRQTSTLQISARRRLFLRPEGSHLLLVGIRNRLRKGDRVPLTLHFEKGGKFEIELEVQASDTRKPQH
jgi:periplasmic copper chaperone A